MTSNTAQRRIRLRVFFVIGLVLALVIGTLMTRWVLQPKELSELRLADRERAEVTAISANMEIKPRVGVGQIQFGMTPDEVIAKLGPPEHRQDDPTVPQTYVDYRKLGLRLIFDTGKAELRAIICMSDKRETLISKSAKPAQSFAGSTAEGIRIGSKFEDVRKTYGPPSNSEQYFPNRRGYPISPGDVVEHAYFQSLMVLEKDERVVEMHGVLPGWTNPPLPKEFLNY